VNPLLFRDYAVKWIGEESKGMTPVAAYLNGQIDPFQMLYDKPTKEIKR
jgi:hypothetical protein